MLQTQRLFTKRLLGTAVAVAALITPAIASAQEAPDAGAAQIQGTISSINGTWNITVADSNGYSDSVALHQGTIINPTGLTLEPGMSVTVEGYPDGANLDAMEIDTPYQYAGPAPTAAYYGPGSWYPGYAAGWGPSFSLVFDLGTRRYEQRAFSFDGRARAPMAPPSGWQDRPHGYVGNAGSPQVSFAPRTRTFAAPPQQRTFVAPQQQPPRSFVAPPQQQQPRSFVAPPQQQQPRSFVAPPQQQQPRSFVAPPQQQQPRSFVAPPQQQQPRTFAGPPQQPRTFVAPPQQARAAAPATRATRPAAQGNLNADGLHR